MMHRFFIPPESLQAEWVRFPSPVAGQMRNVLRLTPGERVVALLDDGWEHEVELTAVEKEKVVGRIIERRMNRREPRIALTLYPCLLKKDRFEWALQKCTEIGVSRFVPVVSQRTIAREAADPSRHRHDRWLRILTEAAEQSGRGRIPALSGVMSLDAALADSAGCDLRAIAWEEEHAQTLRSVVAGAAPASIGLFVGPEGGFSADEVDAARAQGVVPITLGARTLRAETAAVVLAALALHQAGELA